MRNLVVVLALVLAASACADDASTSSGSEPSATTDRDITTDPIDPVSTTSSPPEADTTSTAAVSTTTSSADIDTDPPCGDGGDLTAGVQRRQITTTDGNVRDYLLLLPPEYDPRRAADVVFTFHGSGSSMDAQLAYSNFGPNAAADHGIIVAPNGEFFHPLYGESRAWAANLRPSDVDVDFVHELVELIATEYCTGRFLAAGMSAGGDMVSTLACQPESPFVGFGAVTYLYYDAADCGDAPPRRIRYFHGTDDLVVPLAGNPSNAWNDPPIAEVMDRWAAHNGCDAETASTDVAPSVTYSTWSGCDAATDWYLIDGGGHTWPGATPVETLGATTTEISATDLIWDLLDE